MARFLMLIVLVGGIAYLYHKRQPVQKPEPPPEPPAIHMEPPPVLSSSEIEKIRLSTKDSDPQVRWAAIELLYRIKDPQAVSILEDTLSIDTEASVRRNALQILLSSNKPGVAKELVRALKDSEKDIRLAALMALGDLGDPAVVPEIVATLGDIEPDVRMQALRALGTIQDKRNAQYKPLQDQLRQIHEEMVRQSQKGLPGRSPLEVR